MSDTSQFTQLSYHNSASSERKHLQIKFYIVDNAEPYTEESNFYNKFDEEIFKYVKNVESLVESVAAEREILSKLR